MAILGLVLLVLALIFAVKVLFWLGVIFLIVGLVLEFGPVGGPNRRRYW